MSITLVFFFFQAEDGIRDADVTGVQTCALPISSTGSAASTLPVPPQNQLCSAEHKRHTATGTASASTTTKKAPSIMSTSFTEDTSGARGKPRSAKAPSAAEPERPTTANPCASATPSSWDRPFPASTAST